MSNSQGISERHARSCNPQERCTCTPTFQAHVWDAKSGRRIRRTFDTISAARRWRQDAIVALRNGEMSGDRGPKLSEAVSPWLEGLRAGTITTRSGQAYKPGAVRCYARNMNLRILPALGHLRVSEVSTADVQKLIDDLTASGVAPATISSTIATAQAFYRRAVARGGLRVNPTTGVERPAQRQTERTVVSPAQAAAMLGVLDGADRVLWACAFYTGLRRGELIGLRREDIDLAGGVVRVERGWDAREGEIEPKSRHSRRRVPIPDVLRAQLAGHLLSRPAQRVFDSSSWVDRAAARAGKVWEAAGLPVVHLHDCRHTYASFAIASGLNAKTVSAVMGHSSIALTYDLYGHLLPGSEDEALSRLDAFFEGTVAQTVAHRAISAS